MGDGYYVNPHLQFPTTGGGAIANGVVRGDSIYFQLPGPYDRLDLRGRVAGSTMAGEFTEVRSLPQSGTWTAVKR